MAQRTYPGHTLIGNTATTKRKVENEVIRQLMRERGPDPEAASWLLMFQGEHQPQYWIVLLVKKNATLKAIDKALRDIWLECCSHLSAFTIHGEDYQSSPDIDLGGKSMNARLGNLFSVGLTGEYIYLCGARGRASSERVPSARGEGNRGAPSSLSRRTAHLHAGGELT